MSRNWRHNAVGLDGEKPREAQPGPGSFPSLPACPAAAWRATRHRLGSSQPVAQPGCAIAGGLYWPIDFDRGVAPANFDPDISQCRHGRGHRQLHEGRCRRCFEHRHRYASRRWFDTALTHPAADLIGVNAIGHRNAGDQGARLTTRLNHRQLEFLRMMPPAPTWLLDFHRK